MSGTQRTEYIENPICNKKDYKTPHSEGFSFIILLLCMTLPIFPAFPEYTFSVSFSFCA